MANITTGSSLWNGSATNHRKIAKNKDKVCKKMVPVFTVRKYKEYPNTEVRKLTSKEIEKYMSER